MENTLLIGDRVLAQRFPRPKFVRGDLVVMRIPGGGGAVTVKRIVGVPGDRLRMVDKILFLNGAKCREPYVIHSFPAFDDYRDNLPPRGNYDLAPLPPPYRQLANQMLKRHLVGGEVVVPLGKYFVLGDNRDNSLDSRYFGFVGDRDAVAKPFLIYDSVEKAEELDGKTAAPRRRNERIFKLL